MHLTVQAHANLWPLTKATNEATILNKCWKTLPNVNNSLGRLARCSLLWHFPLSIVNLFSSVVGQRTLISCSPHNQHFHQLSPNSFYSSSSRSHFHPLLFIFLYISSSSSSPRLPKGHLFFLKMPKTPLRTKTSSSSPSDPSPTLKRTMCTWRRRWWSTWRNRTSISPSPGSKVRQFITTFLYIYVLPWKKIEFFVLLKLFLEFWCSSFLKWIQNFKLFYGVPDLVREIGNGSELLIGVHWPFFVLLVVLPTLQHFFWEDW